MAEEGRPEKERRKKETGLFGHVMETLIGKQSRKVAFGIWVFIIANGMRERHTDMPWDLWWKCVLLAGALIGLGTIVDEVVANFGNAVAGFAANKVKAVIETTTETTVTTDAPTAPPQS
jgi:hypothetical protein